MATNKKPPKESAAGSGVPAACRRADAALSAAFVRRLRAKGAEADAGLTIDTTGMSDEEFVALLQRK